MRMLVALGLIVVLPFAFVYTGVHLANTAGIDLLELATGRPYTGEFHVDPLLLSVVVFGALAVQYLLGPRAISESVGARDVDAADYPDFHATVTRLASQLDVAAPAVAVIDTDAPNAFTVAGGTDRVVVTSALLETLTDDELEAVLAHELAHVANRDANLMTVAWLLPTITYYIATAAFYVFYGIYRLRARVSGDEPIDAAGAMRGLLLIVVFALTAFVVFAAVLLTLLVSGMFWAASVLFYRLLSRQREYVADRAAATTTGSPAALASALKTLDETIPDAPERDLRKLDGGTEALYVAPLEFESHAFEDGMLVSTDVFPDSHPPTERRIERLRELAAEPTATDGDGR